MALDLNQVNLAGRLVANPDLKQTQTGLAVGNFTIAIGRYVKAGAEKKTDFLNCTAFGKTAETINTYFKKGSAIFVTGSIQTDNWTGKDGVKKYKTGIMVSSFKFVEKAGANNSGDSSASTYSSGDSTVPNFEEVATGDDLPF